MKPVAIDLFCGKGGWTRGLLDTGWDVIGFDIERYADYPAQLVLQDVSTLDGRQFRAASLIVASPPCQAYSYRAMPWKRAKALPPPDNTLFEACFRIQREASEAAGRHVPLLVENVKGAQPWVGRAKWHYGSFYLWGDVPALMPPAKQFKGFGGSWFAQNHNTNSGSAGNPVNGSGQKVPVYSDPRRNGGKGVHLTSPRENHNGVKVALSARAWFPEGLGKVSSASDSRKAASAQIAMIPYPLARWIGQTYYPSPERSAILEECPICTR